MIFIFITLLIVGIFFPPAWLALAGYAIYVFASRKSRRAEAVENRVQKLISAGRSYATFSDLYFEAARSYAISKGATSPEQDAASATMIVNGRSYFVVFMRDQSGGTTITVTDSRTLENEFERDLQERLQRSSVKKNPIASEKTLKIQAGVNAFVDNYISDMDSGEIDLDKLDKTTSWADEPKKISEFKSYVVAESACSGVAETYVIGMLLQKEFSNFIYACIATAEEQGHGFDFQKEIGVFIMKRGWKVLSEKNQNMAKNTSLTSEQIEELLNLGQS